MNRQKFLRNGLVGTLGIGLMPYAASGNKSFSQDKVPLNRELVLEFVTKAHGDFDSVKKMLAKNPELLHAAHDWGNGDFETALGAASHIGHGPLAKFLISRGARFNLFAAAMLGDFVIIKHLLSTYPELIHAKGPHGLDLIHHARVGGDDSKLVLDFLNEKKRKHSVLSRSEMPARLDIAFPSNPKEERAYQMANFIHDQKGIPIDKYIEANFDKAYIDLKGRDYLKSILQRCIVDMPPASVVLFDGNTKDGSLKMKLQKTDKSTFYYFRFKFTESSPHLINGWAVGGTSKIFDD